jgi:hypothetical protein
VTQSRPMLQICPLRSETPVSMGRNATTCKEEGHLLYEAGASPPPLPTGLAGESSVGSGRHSLENSRGLCLMRRMIGPTSLLA